MPDQQSVQVERVTRVTLWRWIGAAKEKGWQNLHTHPGWNALWKDDAEFIEWLRREAKAKWETRSFIDSESLAARFEERAKHADYDHDSGMRPPKEAVARADAFREAARLVREGGEQ